MFSLKVALSVSPDLRETVKTILKKISAPIAAEMDSVDVLLNSRKDLPFCILLCQVRSEEDLQQLTRIGNRYSGYPVMAIIDQTLDCNLVVQVMRAGAAQIVQAPIDADDFKAAIEKIAIQYGYPPQPCRVIAVLGSKEGCGATTLSIGLAQQIAEQTPDKKTTLVEPNPIFGCLGMRLGIEPRVTIDELIREPESLDANSVRRACQNLTSNLGVLSGPYNKIQTPPMTLSALPRVIGYTCEFSDTAVIDMPYQYTPVYRSILQDVSDIVIVGEQSVSSIHNMQVLTNMLIESHIPATRHIVVNKYQKKLKDFHAKTIRELLGVDSIFIVHNAPAMVSRAENNGELLSGSARTNQMMADLRDLAQFFRLADSRGASPMDKPSSIPVAPTQPFFSYNS